MTRINSKIHKRFLSFLDLFLLRVYERLPVFTKHIGIKFIISGKISVTGNAKTRTRHLGVGQKSLSTKIVKISFSQQQIRTPTGVLGIKCFIFF